jgi:hypothetical protein
MKLSPQSLAQRREQISRQIALQRTELVHAYRDLAKPLAYTQTAIKGAQALKQNAWLVMLAPSLVSLGFSFFGWRKKGNSGLMGLLGLSRDEEKRETERAAIAAKKPLLKWAGYGWTLFKLYRRVRPLLP